MENKITAGSICARYLTPSNASFFKDGSGVVHCVVDNRETFANVHCILCFLISYPDQYVSVCHSDDNGKEHEIGIIEDLNAFPEDVRSLVRAILQRYYHQRIITRIHSVKWEFGVLFFEVETSEGRCDFITRWQADRALEFGRKGKILLDVFENRYVIPSVDELPKADRDKLRRFIFW